MKSAQDQEEEVAKVEETEKKAADDEKKAAEKASRGILAQAFSGRSCSHCFSTRIFSDW